MTSDPTTRSEEVWYEDGNLIVRAESTLFRVYRGVLASKSTVFADMFTVSSPGSSNETLDGCDVVVLQDSAVDTGRFLKALIDVECVPVFQ
jgi:hypothetical protein